MTEAAPEQPIDSLRGRLTDAATQIPGLDNLIGIVQDACESTIKMRVQGHECPKGQCEPCPHVYWVEIPNAKVAMEALRFVLEQTEGRPGVADGVDAGVTVIRQVVGLDEPEPSKP